MSLLVKLPSDWFCWGSVSPVGSTHGGASSLHLLSHAQPFGCIRSGSLVVARRQCFPFRSGTSLRALLLMMTHRHMLFVSWQRIHSRSLLWRYLGCASSLELARRTGKLTLPEFSQTSEVSAGGFRFPGGGGSSVVHCSEAVLPPH